MEFAAPLVLPFLLGFINVMQGLLNRGVQQSFGLVHTLALNASVFCVLSVGLMVCLRSTAAAPTSFWFHAEHSGNLQWWFLLPGLFGLLYVAGIPVALSNSGALLVFLGVITGQIVTGFVYDLVIAQKPFQLLKCVGAVLVFCGALCVAWSDNRS